MWLSGSLWLSGSRLIGCCGNRRNHVAQIFPIFRRISGFLLLTIMGNLR